MPTSSPVLLLAGPGDRAFLDAMLVEAAFPPGTERPADPLGDDHVARYLDGWRGDVADDDDAGDGGGDGGPEVGLVARLDGEPVGAAWTRLLPPDRPGYGFVAADVPELTLAVAASARRAGIGRALVAGVLDLAAARGVARVGLSVADEVNPAAAALYRSLGFEAIGRDEGGSLTMVASAVPSGPPAGPARAATGLDGPALVRLREVMFVSDGRPGGGRRFAAALLARWAEGGPDGPLLAAVVDDDRGRPIASAIAELGSALPHPNWADGRQAYLSSVASEPTARGRGAATACVAHVLGRLDALGVPVTRLATSASGESIYERLGFRRSAHPSMLRPRPT